MAVFAIARGILLWAADRKTLKKLVVKMPVTKSVVKRFISGEKLDDAIGVIKDLKAKGIKTTIDFLGEFTDTVDQAYVVRDAYLELLQRVKDEGLADSVEVSIKLTALGLGLPNGQEIAYSVAESILKVADELGTTATVDMEDHTATDVTLAVVKRLREKYPRTGTVLQSYLYRTVDDCKEFNGKESRIRLCKGAYKEPASVAYQSRDDIDSSYLKCLQVLIEGEGRPMVASHDPKIIEAAKKAFEESGRSRDTFEFQMLYGIRQDAQLELANAGYNMTVYVPYGVDWWGYFVRRLAEKPANLKFFIRALFGK
ncbi:MAG: proline dehydrogenase family protein [Propionibacteriaceae bacterium]|jgi:proline dehydrogenase|nr:proline dehydrogenase family protein [Propionibacteriaceae bacterium]